MAPDAKAFAYVLRGRQLEDQDADKAFVTEKRDQQLEQYLWVPYNHTCMAYDDTLQAFPGAAIDPVLFGLDEHDPESMHDQTTLTSRIAPKLAGIWRVSFSIHAVFTAAAYAFFKIRRNGTDLFAGAGGPHAIGEEHEFSAQRLVFLAESDYVEIVVDHSADVAVDSAADPKQRATFSVEFVSYVKESGLQTD